MSKCSPVLCKHDLSVSACVFHASFVVHQYPGSMCVEHCLLIVEDGPAGFVLSGEA